MAIPVGILTLVVVVLGLRAYSRRRDASFALRLFAGLLLGGALGNMLDRLRLGYVTDWIARGERNAFNLADLAIYVGLGGLALLLLLDGRRRPEEAEPEVEPPVEQPPADERPVADELPPRRRRARSRRSAAARRRRETYCAATTMISTSYSGPASAASIAARTGGFAVSTQASHTSFMADQVEMSVSHTVALSSFDLSVPAVGQELVDAGEDVARLGLHAVGVLADLPGQVDRPVVHDGLAHARAYVVSLDRHCGSSPVVSGIRAGPDASVRRHR